MKVKLSDFSEEIRYVIECPICGTYIESPEDPLYEIFIFCDYCDNDLEIEDNIINEK